MNELGFQVLAAFVEGVGGALVLLLTSPKLMLLWGILIAALLLKGGTR